MYEIDRVLEERPAVSWIQILKRGYGQISFRGCRAAPAERLDTIQEVLKAKGLQERLEVTWDDAYDEVIASDGETVWHGRQFYDYLFEEVLEFGEIRRDSKITFQVQMQLEHDRFSSRNPDKTEFIYRKTLTRWSLPPKRGKNKKNPCG